MSELEDDEDPIMDYTEEVAETDHPSESSSASSESSKFIGEHLACKGNWALFQSMDEMRHSACRAPRLHRAQFATAVRQLNAQLKTLVVWIQASLDGVISHVRAVRKEAAAPAMDRSERDRCERKALSAAAASCRTARTWLMKYVACKSKHTLHMVQRTGMVTGRRAFSSAPLHFSKVW